MSEALVISHYDGHGVVTGTLCARRYGIPIENVIIEFPVTAPDGIQNIENIVSPSILYTKTEFYILDIAVNIKDPDGFFRALHRIFQNARKMTRSYIMIQMMDHHESNLQYVHMMPQFLKYVHFPNSFALSVTFARTNEERQMAIIGAICDRDTSILSLPEFQENRERLLRMADGLDWLVRNDMKNAIDICYNLNFERLLEFSGRIPEPNETSIEKISNNVVIYNEQLPEGWGTKVLERVAIRTNVPYAIGFEYVSRLNQWIVRCITLWTSGARPVREFISTTRTIIGHPSAPTIACTSESDAKRLMREIAESINRNVQTSQMMTSIEHAQQSFTELFDVLVQILQSQQEMYKKYLELKEEQVKLLRETTSERARFD